MFAVICLIRNRTACSILKRVKCGFHHGTHILLPSVRYKSNHHVVSLEAGKLLFKKKKSKEAVVDWLNPMVVSMPV